MALTADNSAGHVFRQTREGFRLRGVVTTDLTILRRTSLSNGSGAIDLAWYPLAVKYRMLAGWHWCWDYFGKGLPHMKRVVGTCVLGILTALFGFVFWANWQRYDTSGTRFLLPGNGRYVLTTFDRLILLGALTIVCGLFFLANLQVLFAADEPKSIDEDDPKKLSRSDAGPSWRCPGCGEDNPGNFEECWKCQRLRRREDEA